MNDYAQYLQLLLPAGGFAYQWVRQHASVPEAWTFVFAYVLAGIIYSLTFNYHAKGLDPQGEILKGIVWVITIGCPVVLGGTFTASKASANIGVIPPTNSK